MSRSEYLHFRRRALSALSILACLFTPLSPIGNRTARADGVGYQETTPLPIGRQMHGSAVLGDNLYVFGGALTGTGWTTSVVRATIGDGSQLGPWTETNPLPINRHYIATSTIVLNDVVYIAGGQFKDTNKDVLNTVAWTRPMADGNLEPWRESPPFSQDGLAFIPVVTTPGHIHLLGGLLGTSQPSNAVITGAISPDGGIAAWEPGPPLPKPLWWHHAAAVGGRVWIWSGLPTDQYEMISQVIYSAPILSSGEIGAWRTEPTPFPEPIFGAMTATAGSYLLSFCPRLNLNDSDNAVWFASVSNQGVGAWTHLPMSLPNLIYFSTATDYRRRTVYVVGGKAKRGGTDPNPKVVFLRLAEGAQETPPPVVAGAPSQAPGAATVGGPGATALREPGGGVTQFSYQAQGSMGAGAVAGFTTYDQARRAAMGPPARPLVLYFNNNASRSCREQAAALNDPRFAALTQQAAFGWVDVVESPQIAQQMGVYKVPTWSLFDTRGNPAGQVSDVLTVNQLAQGVAAAAAANR